MGTRTEREELPRLCARGHHAIEDDPYKKKIPGIVEAVLESLEEENSPDHVGYPMIPSQESLLKIVDLYMTIMMPGYYGNQTVDWANIRFYMGDQINRLYTILNNQIHNCFMHECRVPKANCADCAAKGAEKTLEFLEKIPRLRTVLAMDVKAAYQGDPAAKSSEEIIFCYPGLRAVTLYRFAHELFLQGVPILPRMLSEYAHSLSGCDIHPGAEIGAPFFVDHGTGVVIGETAVIGKNVRLYQGVTLGGLNFHSDSNGKLIRDSKRHPTVEDDCVIYAGATILGGETVVGKGSIIGGNVWLTHSVPPGSKVVARIVESTIKSDNGENT